LSVLGVLDLALLPQMLTTLSSIGWWSRVDGPFTEEITLVTTRSQVKSGRV